MTEDTSRSSGTLSRRAILGATAGLGVGTTSGCLQQLGGVLGNNGPGQLSLTIKTVPADSDTVATRIARRLVEHLTTAGIDARVELQPPTELRRDVLINGDFDIYIGEHPERHDPDFLRPLLHSVYDGEGGWQNPFDFTDLTVDSHLVDQRAASGATRREIVDNLQRQIASKQPFGVIAFPDEIWAARTDRFSGWSRYPMTEPLSYIALDTAGDGRRDQLRVTTTNGAPTRNLNPLAPQQRTRGIFTGLLYDPLARWVDGSLDPWLATEWSWDRQEGDAIGTVTLRDDLRWHDGRPLTAEDVAFTYRFLNDTLLGNGSTPVPAFRFRGQSSLVESVTVTDDRSLELRCRETSSEVADRALTAPVLPAHVWSERAVERSPAWADGSRTLTDSVVWNNPRPVGSGVVQFENSAGGSSLTLSRFDDHFLHRDAATNVPDPVEGGVAFDQLSVQIVPSDAAAIQQLSGDRADATAMSIAPSAVPRVGEDDSLELHVTGGKTFYHVGFNTDREPLGNPHVRRAIVKLLDKSDIAEKVFSGYARAAASPLAGTDWVSADLEWTGTDPEVPFLGENGTLDEQRAKDMFRDAGFEYSDSGRLLD